MRTHILIYETRINSGFNIFRSLQENMNVRTTFICNHIERYPKTTFSEYYQYIDEIVELSKLGMAISLDCIDKIPENMKPWLLQKHALEPFSAVFTLSQQHIGLANQIAKFLQLPHANPRSIEIGKDKLQTREVLTSLGFAQPKFCEEKKLPQFLSKVDFPLIVKPRYGVSSIGVMKVNNAEQLATAMQEIRLQNNLGISQEPIIEEYIDSPQCSVEVIADGETVQVIGVTSKRVTKPPYAAELGGVFPANIPEREKILREVEKGLTAIGFDLGAAHVEVFLAQERIVILEFNLRLAGALVPEMMSLALQKDIYTMLARVHLGERCPQISNEIEKQAFLYPVVADRKGTLREIRFEHSIAKNCKWYPHVQSGQQVRPPYHNNDRLGFLVGYFTPSLELPTVEEYLKDKVEIIYE